MHCNLNRNIVQKMTSDQLLSFLLFSGRFLNRVPLSYGPLQLAHHSPFLWVQTELKIGKRRCLEHGGLESAARLPTERTPHVTVHTVACDTGWSVVTVSHSSAEKSLFEVFFKFRQTTPWGLRPQSMPHPNHESTTIHFPLRSTTAKSL